MSCVCFIALYQNHPYNSVCFYWSEHGTENKGFWHRNAHENVNFLLTHKKPSVCPQASEKNWFDIKHTSDRDTTWKRQLHITWKRPKGVFSLGTQGREKAPFGRTISCINMSKIFVIEKQILLQIIWGEKLNHMHYFCNRQILFAFALQQPMPIAIAPFHCAIPLSSPPNLKQDLAT